MIWGSIGYSIPNKFNIFCKDDINEHCPGKTTKQDVIGCLMNLAAWGDVALFHNLNDKIF